MIDLIYNPARTKLLLDAERAGAAAVNGLSMLVAQAKQSCELFTGRPISDSTIEEIAGEIEALTKNIILIGMPGCGKSTVGANLAHVLNRPFVDIDDVIESRIAMTICDFFKAYGEKAFRKIETEVLAEYAKGSGQIIATGGGIVTIPENLPLMRQNGTIVLAEPAAPRASGRRPPDFNVLRSRTSGAGTSSPLSVVEGCFRQVRKSGGNDAQHYLASASAAASF